MNEAIAKDLKKWYRFFKGDVIVLSEDILDYASRTRRGGFGMWAGMTAEEVVEAFTQAALANDNQIAAEDRERVVAAANELLARARADAARSAPPAGPQLWSDTSGE